MKKFNYILLWIMVGILTFSSCDEGESYADLLKDETTAVNAFLADQKIENVIPKDSIFEYGENAP